MRWCVKDAAKQKWWKTKLWINKVNELKLLNDWLMSHMTHRSTINNAISSFHFHWKVKHDDWQWTIHYYSKAAVVMWNAKFNWCNKNNENNLIFFFIKAMSIFLTYFKSNLYCKIKRKLHLCRFTILMILNHNI